MTATLKELIDARLLAPGPIVFKYNGDTHAGTLRDDGNIKVGQHVFKKPGNWGSHLYPSVKLNGFHQLYTPTGTKIQKLRNQLKAQNQQQNATQKSITDFTTTTKKEKKKRDDRSSDEDDDVAPPRNPKKQASQAV
jgi:hypothetical protein